MVKVSSNGIFELSSYQQHIVDGTYMDPEIKVQWLEALRSGNYKQGKSALKMQSRQGGTTNYCCLGVLCELVSDKDEWVKQETTRDNIYGIPDEDKREEAAFSYLPLQIRTKVFKHSDAVIDRILGGFNDLGATFEEIADWIEENL